MCVLRPNEFDINNFIKVQTLRLGFDQFNFTPISFATCFVLQAVFEQILITVDSQQIALAQPLQTRQFGTNARTFLLEANLHRC